MHKHATNGLAIGLLTVVVQSATSADDRFGEVVRPFLTNYCIDCHGAPDEEPEAGVALGIFEDRSSALESLPLWKRVVDIVDSSAMPPSYMDQPTDSERAAALSAMRDLLAHPELGEHRKPGRPVLRRLTRLEYNNTVRDLLGLDVDVFVFPERLPFDKQYFDPAAGKMPERLEMAGREYGAKYPVFLRDAGLPGDNRAEHGFSNRGDAQDLSAVRFEQYIKLASEIAHHPDLVGRAARMQELLPEAEQQARAFAERQRRSQPKPIPRVFVDSTPSVADNGNVSRSADGSEYSLEDFAELIHEAYAEDRGGAFDAPAGIALAGKGGLLQVAYGERSKHVVGVNPTEDLWTADFGTAQESSGNSLIANRAKGEKLYAFAFQKDNGSGWLGLTSVGLVVLSREGESGTVQVTAQYTNGASRTVPVELAAGAGSDNVFLAFRAPEGSRINRLTIDGSQFSGDYVLVDDLAMIVDEQTVPATVAGREVPKEKATPSVSSTPSPTENLRRDLAEASPRERLKHFLQRAFRRPVESHEVDRYLAVYESMASTDAGDEIAMRKVIEAVLCSPHFLYVVQTGDPTQEDEYGLRPLTDHQLATRLSYFLWSTMPDDELMQLASEGRLQDPDVLAGQARRMLKDRRARELSDNFFVEWLRLRELWSAQPDTKQFRKFYSQIKGKRTAARDFFGEALLLFETVMVEDRSILEFIDAPFMYVNSMVAKLYKLEGDTLRLSESGNQVSREDLKDDRIWYRVELEDARRGGILTSGAVLTLTSLPERTSPIKRGVWILDAIFNRPPPPPQLVVPQLEEQNDDTQQLSLRERVELHRANPVCASCHDRIDPPGFALENYDAIGAWREKDGGDAIDPSGALEGGKTFKGPEEFKARLLERHDRFVRGFVEHLLSYALNRELEYYDSATIEAIVDQCEKADHRFSCIVEGIVRSPSFRYTQRSP